ncbi:hypothetical protein [Thalassospira sp.]|uniref:hypothetical protein n=1 Tax=Thalassospira sp. TaxID=1912094 RepID=UPI00261FD7FB|nr:hypothetical protein [Thalassospira sp.]MCH2276460.1 hypothetical protein [Thalassospira sp.]
MKKYLNVAVIAVALLVLAGCMTASKYEEILNSWVGQSEQSLIASWGPPTSHYDAGNAKYLTYSNQGSMTLPGTQPTYQSTVIGNQIYTTSYGGSAPTTIALSCQQTFTVVRGYITSWRYQGNNCY